MNNQILKGTFSDSQKAHTYAADAQRRTRSKKARFSVKHAGYATYEVYLHFTK